VSGDLVIRNASLATLAAPAPRRGSALGDPGLVESAALVARAGRLSFVGPESGLDPAALPTGARVIDAEGALVLPGFVDPHTHIVFSGDRDDELRRRLAGASYAEIAASGGGIVRSVEATRAASLEELEAGLRARLDELLLAGTTTAEVKSGYGLETGAELRSLEAIARAGADHPVSLVPTFLGAHEIPLEHRSSRERYVELVCTEMIPEVARRGLARFCDVFCERGVFTVSESRRILVTAREAGMDLRLHADELADSGGAGLAAELGARSADHLVHVTAESRRRLAEAGCAATLLPGAAFYLKLGRYAPARELIGDGVTVALASDSNPGGGLSPSMPFAMTLACFGMGLSLEEALCAATLNAAWTLGLEHEAGSLVVGKRADLVMLRSPRLIDLVRVGVRVIRRVVVGGRVVVEDGARVGGA
jgi:imidazolonepropionase